MCRQAFTMTNHEASPQRFITGTVDVRLKDANFVKMLESEGQHDPLCQQLPAQRDGKK